MSGNLATKADAGDNALVRFHDVSKSFNGAGYAVDRLNLDIREGEFLTLLGPSGSGKTTTLMMLAGFEAPSDGDIRTQQGSILALPPHRRDFGVVFQSYALFPHLSILDNVAFPLSVRGVANATARSKAADVLKLVRLESFGARRPHELSGGQQQRAALARAIVFDPILVLMDEPFGALDKSLREQMQIEIRQIHRRLGNTMVSVTHDQSEALTMSDRVAVFNEGRLEQVGTPEEVYERPANAFVASFIGDSNMAPARVEGFVDGRCILRLAQGESVTAMARQALVEGDEVLLSIRPERMRLGGSASPNDNCFCAIVMERVYTGERVVAILSILGRSDWTVKLAPELAGNLKVGDQLNLGWSAQDCSVFRKSAVLKGG